MNHGPKPASFLQNHWFLVVLVTLLPIGMVGANYLRFLTSVSWPRTTIVVVVMWMMALPIPLEMVRLSIRKPWPSVLASLVNMVGIPLLVWSLTPLVSLYYGGGLMVAAAIPCTLASAAVWTRRAGGDDTVAVLVTLITNVACVVVTPMWLVVALGRRVNLDVQSLVTELFLVVLLPMTVAQLMRMNKSVAGWAERKKQRLSIACQIGILLMVFLGAIEMGLRSKASDASSAVGLVSWLEIAWVLVLTAGVHLVGLVIGWFVAGKTGIARPQQIGVAISGSQKTLMVGLKLAMDCGVSIMPMVAYHIGQLLMDTLIADYWKRGESSLIRGRTKSSDGQS